MSRNGDPEPRPPGLRGATRVLLERELDRAWSGGGGPLLACGFFVCLTAVLPLAVCHVRDALCYAHSTAIYLHASGTLGEGRERWTAWVARGSAEMRAVLGTSVRRMGWMRHLPTNRKLGRDLQRVRAAYELLSR